MDRARTTHTRATRTYDRRCHSLGGSTAADRSGVQSRFKSHGNGRAAQGEFALPKTTTEALPAVESFADLAMPAPLPTVLGHEGVTVPFPIHAATPPNRWSTPSTHRPVWARSGPRAAALPQP